MSRNVSSVFKQAVFSQETDEVFIVLLTIDGTPPLRVTSDGVNTASRGNTFIPYPFQIYFPSDDKDVVSEVNLAIDNIDRTIVNTIRSLSSPPNITLEVVLASAPDIVEGSWGNFRLKTVRYDSIVVTGKLVYEDILNETIPVYFFTPANTPGLFA